MVLLIVGYALSVHLAVALQLWQLQAVAITLLAAIALYAPLKRGNKWVWFGLGLLAILAFVLARSVAAEWLLYFPPVLMPLMLLAVFAPTLVPGRTPIISQVAHAIRGDLPDELAAYTRRVTVLWVGIFLVMAVVHAGLAVLGPREWWSLVTNFLTYVVVGVLFFAEHCYHRIRYRQYWHPSFIEFLRGMTRINLRELGHG